MNIQMCIMYQYNGKINYIQFSWVLNQGDNYSPAKMVVGCWLDPLRHQPQHGAS